MCRGLSVGAACPRQHSIPIVAVTPWLNKGRTVWEGQLRIDDCLRRRADGVPAIDVSGVEVSLPELIDLLDKKLFMSKKASR